MRNKENKIESEIQREWEAQKIRGRVAIHEYMSNIFENGLYLTMIKMLSKKS